MKHLGLNLAIGLSTFGFGVLVAAIWTAFLQCPITDDSKVVLISQRMKLPKPSSPTPQEPQPSSQITVEQAKQSELQAQNEEFKIVPEAFKQIDFKNYSYPYKFSYGRKINIALKDGEYEYDIANDRGWFSLSDVYYVDLTKDGKPEAIVMLWHVSCGVSCDGGAGLFYIYTTHQNKSKRIWQYETGSLGYGCGLKSLTVKNRKIRMELFGQCFHGNDESSVMGKFLVKDATRLTFWFNGRKFVKEKKEFISSSERDVRNYEPEIRINK